MQSGGVLVWRSRAIRRGRTCGRDRQAQCRDRMARVVEVMKHNGWSDGWRVAEAVVRRLGVKGMKETGVWVRVRVTGPGGTRQSPC